MSRFRLALAGLPTVPILSSERRLRLRSALLLPVCIASLLVGATLGVDAPPTTISPTYSPCLVPQATPKNISDVGKLLAAALGGSDKIDKSAYYVIHRMDYDLDAQALSDVGWYIYYWPWEHTKAVSVAWLDDPLIHGDYKRARIYGSTNVRLVPIMVLPSLDFSRADQATVKALEIQAAKAIATKSDSNTLYGTLGNAQALGKVIESYGHLALSPDESKDPASVLNDFHLVPNHLFTGINVANGDRLASVEAIDINASNLSTDQVRTLKQLSAWVVRETLDGYAQGMRDALTSRSISNVQWKPSGSPDSMAITLAKGSMYVLADTLKILPHYRVTVTAREPQPSSDFKTLLGLIAQGAPIVTFTIDSSADFRSLLPPGQQSLAETDNRTVRVGALPVDIAIDAIKPDTQTGTGSDDKKGNPPKAGQKNADGTNDAENKNGNSGQKNQSNQDANALSSIKIQNEKKYLYGIGVGLPLKSFDSVEYDSTNSIITAKKIEKQNVFGFFEFHPYATDTSGVRLRLLPTLMAGLPIAGKPLDQQIYAVNFGLWKAEPFIGLLVHRDLVPAGNAASNTTSSVSDTGASLTPRWGARLTYGINVPLSVVKSALSSKKSTSTNTSNSGGKSGKSAPDSK